MSKKNKNIFLNDNDNLVTDQRNVTNLFNKYFPNVSANLLEVLFNPTKFQDYLKDTNKNSFYLNEKDPEEMR